MDSVNLVGLGSFAVVTTFTPGPNNLIVAALGIQIGLRRTLPSIYGIVTGFLVLMLVCGYFSRVLLEVLPALATWVRWAGCGYILWLAYKTATSGFKVEAGQPSGPGGFLPLAAFQFMNPKAVTCGLTVYSGFLADYVNRAEIVLLTGLALATCAFVAVVAWTTFGSLFNRHLGNPVVRKWARIVTGLMLVYAAIDLVWS